MKTKKSDIFSWTRIDEMRGKSGIIEVADADGDFYVDTKGHFVFVGVMEDGAYTNGGATRVTLDKPATRIHLKTETSEKRRDYFLIPDVFLGNDPKIDERDELFYGQKEFVGWFEMSLVDDGGNPVGVLQAFSKRNTERKMEYSHLLQGDDSIVSGVF